MTLKNRTVFALAAVAGGLFAASAANAEVLVSMTYDDLRGAYTASSPTDGQFTAHAVSQLNPRIRSSGDVSRLVPGFGTAFFDPGFVSGPDLGAFTTAISVVGIVGNSATGTGSFTSTDADGDTITGLISGTWIGISPTPGTTFLTFAGVLSGVSLNDNGPLDGTFDGSGGGSFGLNLPGNPPYDGAVVVLSFGNTGFFNSNFDNRATSFAGQIVPAPGALALVGLGGLVAIRRRR